jgi:hypothetical protein
LTPSRRGSGKAWRRQGNCCTNISDTTQIARTCAKDGCFNEEDPRTGADLMRTNDGML